MKRKVGLITQARMTSTRLPGKVLMEVLQKPLLGYQIERLRSIKSIDEMIVATTTNSQDDIIVELCEKWGVNYFRGSENDVLERYYLAAQQFNLDTVIRVTSDCPLIDPKTTDKILRRYLYESDQCDYFSNTVDRTFPRGLDTEIFSFERLKEAFINAKKNQEREHVTLYFYSNPEKFKIKQFRHHEDLSHLRWTVDTREDFALIKIIIEALYPKNPLFDLAECLQFVKKNPDLASINAHVQQKNSS